MPDRRALLAGAGALFGTSLAAPLARALAADAVPAGVGMVDAPRGFSASRPVFSADTRALLAAVCERIMPTTDTPGAGAAGVPAFIEMMMADWYSQGDRMDFLAGLIALDDFARGQNGAGFATLTPDHQDAVLTAAMNQMMPGLPAGFFDHCRQLVILGYYTSEIGCKQERIYLPVPGRYDGAYLYASAGRIFSS